MKPRAFVVMPFHRKPLGETSAIAHKHKPAAKEIDFDQVFEKLLEPALRLAGLDAVRADSDIAAGDIRTDMFFELVTADLVVADISIPNPNVFYELGVRHGVAPRGVFVVQGNFSDARPFDVAPDRSFSYDGSFFLQPKPRKQSRSRKTAVQGDPKALHLEIERLGHTFKHALAAERETIGSPVYQHLPGLEPVNWDKIQTSKAAYFGALRDDWLECVKIAQSKGHAGDILTLADDAPTIAHRTKILYQAALALIDMCRYRAAESALTEVIEHDPKCFDAQLQLGRVFAHQGKTEVAEHHLRSILRAHEDDPNAADLLGQVSRNLWHLSWRDELPEARLEKAMDTSQMAALAVRSFIRAQHADARAYYAGFNALILIGLLDHLREKTKRQPVEIMPDKLQELVGELTTVVKFCARNSRERAIEKGDYVEQFWTTTTLAGISMIQDDNKKALQRIREACSIPGATFFQLHTFEERLALLDELDFQPKFVKPALELVCQALAQKNRQFACNRVFLWSGYPLDRDGQTAKRFPSNRVGAVQKQIAKVLDDWKPVDGDLAICEGIHESDILFAEACLHRRGKIRVRMMLLEPADGQSAPLWPFQSPEWERRFHDLRSALGENVWFHAEHLGPVLGEAKPQRNKALERRHRNRMINTARIEAEPILEQRCKPAAEPSSRLFGLFLWNGEGDSDNPASPAYFIRLVNEFNGYEGQVRTINALKDGPS